jgi:salicylate hydroxylase
MLPFAAQGAAMAIEDAATLGHCLGQAPGDLPGAMRSYEGRRLTRTARAQREARRNGDIYHAGGPAGLLRTLAVAATGGDRLISRYDWLYGWTPPS